MRAAIFDQGQFTVGDFPLPDLQAGQMRVSPIANGICGTDLSAWEHTGDFLAAAVETHQELYIFDEKRPLVFGHEFTAEVTELGPGVEEFSVGQKLFVLPAVIDGMGVLHCVGFANDYPGGMATESVVMGFMHVPLEGVDPVLAATLEPVATGVNGASRTVLAEGGTALVTGVGPVGLGAVVEFAARGAGAIVVSDPSAKRREIALAYGATVAIDPRDADPVEAARALVPPGGRLHVVESSGAKGVLEGLLGSVPAYTNIAVVGGGTAMETMRPISAVMKNLTVSFVSGPGHGELRYEAVWRAYEHLREGRYDPTLMVTAYTGLAGAARAFAALRPADSAVEQVKILILPGLDTDELLTREQAGLGPATPIND